MSKKNVFQTVIGTILIFLAAMALRAADEHPAGKDVRVGPGETQKRVFCLGGDVLIEGNVREDVVAFGGSITINGTVAGDVLGIGSVIRVGPTAVIEGDVAALGGKLDKEPGCRIKGETVYIQSAEINDRLFRKGPLRGLFSLKFTPFFLILKVVSLFVWAFLVLLAAGLIPARIEFASRVVRESFWPVFWTGLLAMSIFIALVIFSAVLCLILIGIPILLAAVAIGMIIKIFGEIAVFLVLGRWFLNAIGTKNTSTLGMALMGLAIVSVVGLVPVAGNMFSFGVAILAWGAAVRTRFGTTGNWFSRTAPVREPSKTPGA